MFVPEPSNKIPPCQCGCPNGNDVRGWLGVIAQRDRLGLEKESAYRIAWERLTEGNPFPATMGRICPHPCEAGCSRSEKDGPVAVQALERFLGDWALRAGLALRKEPAVADRESVGVIGGGPAGLSFAYQMARRGYRVTLYEQGSSLGGMLLRGIPEYRLPERILDREIARIVDLGVEVRLETRVGRDVALEDLRARHAALFVAIGAQAGRALGVPGENGPQVFTGVDFLAAVNRGEPPAVGARVVVVGGGNTAVDASRIARRLGAAVTVLYRRSRDEMPAVRDEIDEALAEGVDLVLLAAPVRIVREGGTIVGVEAQRMRLGDRDDSGRRRPAPVPASIFFIPADQVIVAVSQLPIWDFLDGDRGEEVWARGESDAPIEDAVWAGGDVCGLGIAGMAIAQGRRAAESVDRRLRGVESADSEDLRRRVAAGEVKPRLYSERARVVPPSLAVEERLAEPDREVAGTLDEAQFLAEASRCFSCGLCFGCQRCWTYCNGLAFTRVVEPKAGAYFTVSLDRCEECGKCVDLCPSGYLSLRPGPDPSN